MIFVVILITSLGVLFFMRDSTFVYKQGVSAEYDKAALIALKVYKDRAKEIDLENGSCLTNDLIPNWVADIVHNPRQPVDNLPENQCPAYLEGRAKHFVELDQKGNIIRVQ